LVVRLSFFNGNGSVGFFKFTARRFLIFWHFGKLELKVFFCLWRVIFWRQLITVVFLS
jgi:hypothetical protein